MHNMGDVAAWISATTNDSTGLATWLGLFVAAAGGGIALGTYINTARLQRKAVSNEQRTQVSKAYSWTDAPYTRFAAAIYDYSPLKRGSFEEDGWRRARTTLPDGTAYDFAFLGAPSVHVHNGSDAPLRIDGIRLRWTGVINHDENHPWAVIEETTSLRLLSAESTTVPLWEETIIPPFAAGVRLDWPGTHLQQEVPWTLPGKTVDYELDRALRFVMDSFLLDPPSGVDRTALMAVLVEMAWVDLTDSLGRAWRHTSNSIEERNAAIEASGARELTRS